MTAFQVFLLLNSYNLVVFDLRIYGMVQLVSLAVSSQLFSPLSCDVMNMMIFLGL